MSNLRLINETEITSSVSSVDVTNVFSADFDIYKITATEISTVGTTNGSIEFRFINESGSVITASNYDRADLLLKAETSFTENRATNDDSITAFGAIDQSAEGSGTVAYVFNPYSSSSYSFYLSQYQGHIATVTRGDKAIGVLKQTASMTGFHLLFTQTVNSGFIRCYGLRVD